MFTGGGIGQTPKSLRLKTWMAFLINFPASIVQPIKKRLDHGRNNNTNNILLGAHAKNVISTQRMQRILDPSVSRGRGMFWGKTMGKLLVFHLSLRNASDPLLASICGDSEVGDRKISLSDTGV